MTEYLRVAVRCIAKEGKIMPKLLAISALLTSVGALLAVPHAAWAQTCNPAIAAGFLTQCPPVTRHLHVYHGDYYRDRGDGGFNDFSRGYGHGGGMGQGGGHGR
jgi:hypothetical protein